MEHQSDTNNVDKCLKLFSFINICFIFSIILFITRLTINNSIEISKCKIYASDVNTWTTLALMCTSSTDFCRNITIYAAQISAGFNDYLHERGLDQCPDSI